MTPSQASAVATSARLGVDPARDRWLACLPLAHVGGLAVVTRALDTGTPYRARAVRRRRVSSEARVAAPPWSPWWPRPCGRTDPSCSGPWSWAVPRRPRSLPENVVTTYGMTETGSGVVYDGVPLDGRRGADRGRFARVRRARSWSAGPMLLRAYRDGHDPKLDGGWLPTGDGGPRCRGPSRRARADGRGHRDRRRRTCGRLSWSTRSPATPGWPKPPCGSGPTPNGASGWWPGWSPSTRLRPRAPDELRELVAAQVAPWAAPKEVEVVSELPRTPSGKVRRADLT